MKFQSNILKLFLGSIFLGDIILLKFIIAKSLCNAESSGNSKVMGRGLLLDI